MIEKLGITKGPWDWNMWMGVYSKSKLNLFKENVVVASEVKCTDANLIAAAPEMLEALIAWGVYAERFCFTDTNGNNPFKIIEKATGKTWSEIKELINE